MMKVLVVGLGVMGGSLAMALNESEKYTVYGVDIDKTALDKAESMGIIVKGYDNAKEILSQMDVIIIGLYPKLVAKFLEENAGYFKTGAVCMDVTGIKQKIIGDVLRVLPDNVDFVFTHPMAGRENKGIDFASADVLKGANFIITPLPQNSSESLEIVRQMAEDCGFGKISSLSPEEHDGIIAFTSQLSHVIATSLINSDTESLDTGSFIGDSYRGITRIASINAELWTELFFGNKENILNVIDNFQAEVARIRGMIEHENSDELRKFLKKASQRRKKII